MANWLARVLNIVIYYYVFVCFIGSDSMFCKPSILSNMHTWCSLTGKMIFIILSFVLSMVFVWSGNSHLQKKSRQTQTSILKYTCGSPMEPKFASVTWDWTDPCVVGESMIFFIHVSWRVTFKVPLRLNFYFLIF